MKHHPRPCGQPAVTREWWPCSQAAADVRLHAMGEAPPAGLQPVGASVRRSPDLVTLLGRVMSACRLFALAFHCWTYCFRWSYQQHCTMAHGSDLEQMLVVAIQPCPAYNTVVAILPCCFISSRGSFGGTSCMLQGRIGAGGW